MQRIQSYFGIGGRGPFGGGPGHGGNLVEPGAYEGIVRDRVGRKLSKRKLLGGS
jgi:hypothetical protein